MKRCYLDANILIALKIEDSPHHTTSIKVIEKLISDETDFFISPLTLDEFLHPMKYFLGLKYKKVYPTLKLVLKEVLDLPNLTLVNPPTDLKSQLEIVKLMEGYRLRPRDAYHLLIIRSHDISHLATLDTDFDLVYNAKLVERFIV